MGLKSIISLSIFLLISVFTFGTANAQANKELLVEYTDQYIRTAYKLENTADIWIDFNKVGTNSIIGIAAFHTASNSTKNVSSDLHRPSSLMMKSGTDWIGPYIVKSDKEFNYRKPSFTGGWHGSNFDGSGNPTAKTIKFKLYADANEVALSKITPCNCVKLYVINLIQGYNTVSSKDQNKYILKEQVLYTIYPRRIDVWVETEALEDCTIIKYYGLQTQNSAWKGKIFYYDNQNYYRSFDSTINSSSDLKNNNSKLCQFLVVSKSGNDGIKAWIDRNYGLGRMNYVRNDLPYAFTLSYGKSYFNLINGIPKSLKKGEKITWRGGYILY